MKVLTLLKHFINFIFVAFILSAILMIVVPFYNQAYTDYNASDTFWMLIIFPVVHSLIIFMILFYLRKFVNHSHIGTPLDKSTRKYLKMSGVFCLISGLIRIPEVIGIIEFYRISGEFDPLLVTNGFIDFGSLFYIILIGLFFIYLAIVLESSDVIRQENKLTI